jgi:ribonuclease E
VGATATTPISSMPQIVSAAVVSHDEAKADAIAPAPVVGMPVTTPEVVPINLAAPARDIGQASDAQPEARPTPATAAPAAPVIQQPSKSADTAPPATLVGMPEKPTSTSPIASLPLPKQGDLLAQPVHPVKPAAPSHEESKPMTALPDDEHGEHKNGSHD